MRGGGRRLVGRHAWRQESTQSGRQAGRVAGCHVDGYIYSVILVYDSHLQTRNVLAFGYVLPDADFIQRLVKCWCVIIDVPHRDFHSYGGCGDRVVAIDGCAIAQANNLPSLDG